MAEPVTGKLAFLEAPKKIEIQSYEVPAPGDGAVLAETGRANVCGSERHIWNDDYPLIEQNVLGHEAICRVASLGDGVETDYAGNLVGVSDLSFPPTSSRAGSVRTAARTSFASVRTVSTLVTATRGGPALPRDVRDPLLHPPGPVLLSRPRRPQRGDRGQREPRAVTGALWYRQGRRDLGRHRRRPGAGGLGLNAVAVASERGRRRS